MTSTRQWIPLGALAGTIGMAAYMVVQLHGQTAVPAADFTSATTAQVRDAQGRIVLEGQFTANVMDGEDVERGATLTQTGVDPDAAGEAEIEFAATAPVRQEVEFSVTNLQPGTAFRFLIDGVEVASATSDRRGRAEVEVDVPLPGAAPSR